MSEDRNSHESALTSAISFQTRRESSAWAIRSDIATCRPDLAGNAIMMSRHRKAASRRSIALSGWSEIAMSIYSQSHTVLLDHLLHTIHRPLHADIDGHIILKIEKI